MALKATIYKVRLSLANLNIHHYQDYQLTLALHPSETTERMLFRLIAFSLHCQENPEFTKGLSSDSEPDLWKINYDGSIDHWIEMGHPDERRIRQVCSKAKEVSIYSYQGNLSEKWFESIKGQITRFDHLNITQLEVKDGQDLTELVERGMNFDIQIDQDEIWISSEAGRINLIYRELYKKKMDN